MELGQRVFHTFAVGDYIKIYIIAYDDNPETRVSKVLQIASILAGIVGVPYITEIGAVFSKYEEKTGRPLFENKDDS